MNSRQVPFSKISRDWFLGSCLYDSIVDRDISQTIILLETKKANPNVLLPEYGISPFHLVIGSEDRKFACRATKACLLNGADPNIRSDEGLTPVHVAAMWGYTDILDVLLSAGGNPWLVDYDGKNAFQYAEEEKNWEAYTVLYNNCDTRNFSTTNTFYDIPASMEEQKNMILCRGDLCIEYDAEPMKDSYSLFHSPLHKKSVSTQTPTRRYKDAKPCSTCHVIVQDDDKNKITNTSHKDSLSVQFDWDKQVRDISIHSEALNTILNHRKKTTIYACSSKKDVYNNHRCNLEKEKHNGVESCPSQNTKKSIKNIKENFLFEFKSKIEQANKHLHDKDKNWQNIIFKTLHEKRESSALDLNHDNKIQDNVCQNEPVLDSNYSESGIIYNEREEEASNLKTESYDSHLHLQSSTDESSASSYRSMQGIMKDNHTASNCDQTSIFSDIDSDISVCVVSGSFQSTKSISKMLTDDELSLSEELMPSKISVNNYFSCNENINSSTASISRTPHTTHNEFNSSENKNVYSEEAEKIQPVCIQNSRECDLTVDSNETGAVIGCEVCNDQITSCAHKWEEADVGFTSDDDKEHGISEEYVYTDEEEGIVLTEKRFGVNSVSSNYTEPRNTRARITETLLYCILLLFYLLQRREVYEL